MEAAVLLRDRFFVYANVVADESCPTDEVRCHPLLMPHLLRKLNDHQYKVSQRPEKIPQAALDRLERRA